MPPSNLFTGDPEETHAAIMHATYRALCEHGYADLTIQRIADEFPKSKSLLYHHYDSKDELLVDFLGFLLDHFKTDVPSDDPADGHAHLQALLDHALPESLDEERAEFASAMTELRAQAPHDEAYRDQFTRTDRFFRDCIAAIIREGIDQGVFRAVDPDRTAGFIATTIHGARAQRVTTDDAEPIAATRRELTEYIRARLLTEATE